VAGIENVIAELGADLEIDLEDLLERDDLPVRDELGPGVERGSSEAGDCKGVIGQTTIIPAELTRSGS